MRVHYRTFGCKANQYDTERMRQELEALGAETVERWSLADVCVVNTCTVTQRADAEARRFTRRLSREAPGARVIVAGCSAALHAEEYRSLPAVADVVPGHDPVRVARAAAPGLVQIEVGRSPEALAHEPVGGALLRRRRAGARGWLKVQDGCDRRCSFCATRLARGPSRSRAPADVLAEARLLAPHHAELVLTGIHIGHYGRDLDYPTSLGRLVAQLLEGVPGIRIRLGSVEATEIDDDLLALLAESDGSLAPHVHMPLQSGSNAVLERMRRWHTREAYRRRALEIVSSLPGLGLGADVITGFPGETDADHADTLALVEELPFTYLHVFPFSPRSGTPAAELQRAAPVPQRVAGERARELRELAAAKGRRHRAARVGQKARVVVDGPGGALTGDYLRVRLAGSAPPPGAPGLRRALLRGSADDLYIDLSHHVLPHAQPA